MPVPQDPGFYDYDGSATGLPAATGPLPSGGTPVDVTEPPSEESEVVSEEETVPDPPMEFDSRVREPFTGLLYLGYLEDSFQWLGHKFRIRTLKSGELLEIALVVKQYADTIGASRAYADATAAACLMKVDGRDLPVAITTDPDDTDFVARFEYVSKTYHPPVIDLIYDRYLRLEEKVQEAIAAMGKAPG